MNPVQGIIVLCLVFGSATFVRADFPAEVREAHAQLQKGQEQAMSLFAEGRVEDAIQLVLNTFPENERTAAQSYVLGRIMFEMGPEYSYPLHQNAANQLPDQPDVQYEWAREQHRVGEYAGAIEGYATSAAAKTNSALVYGLWAECLIRTGKIQQAVETWRQLGDSFDGAQLSFAAEMREVHAHSYALHERGLFIAKAKNGDIDAADKLIWLDAHWPVGGLGKAFLEKDLLFFRGVTFKNEGRAKEIVCAGECALMTMKLQVGIEKTLQQSGFFLDDKKTLPESSRAIHILLSSAIVAKAIHKDDARHRWGAAILDRAKKQKDAILFDVAAMLYHDNDELSEIHLAGWETTGEARFAAARLARLAANDKLTLDDPELTKAVRQFPENAEIAGIVVRLTAEAKKPLEPALIAAIKAEYSHFADDESRIDSARMLRTYFLKLDELLATPK